MCVSSFYAITLRHTHLSVVVIQKLERFMYSLTPIFRTNNATKTFQNLIWSECPLLTKKCYGGVILE